MITSDAEYVRFVCRYDPDSGILTRVRKRRPSGEWYECNTTPTARTAYGYLQIRMWNRPWVVHRIIWLYVTGVMPQHDVDHIDGDRTNNRWVNLRQVSRQDNLRNCGIRDSNTSGHTGVSFAKDRGSWHAYIGVGNARRTLGYFKTLELAIEARQLAEVEIGYHPNHGRREIWRA